MPRFAPGLAALLRCFAFVHACLFPLSGKKEAACGILRSYSAGSRSPLVRSRCVSAVICLCGFTSGLCVSLWRSRRVTGDARNERTGLRVWRRGLCASLRGHIGLAMLSAGSTLGLRAPDCAKESKVEAALPPLWTLFTLRRGWVGADSQRLRIFAQPHWPCNAFRGEYAGAKCGSRTAAAPDCAKESNVGAALRPLWTLLTLRRGYVGAYTRRPQAAKNRVDTRRAVWKPHCGWPGGSCCIAIISIRTIGDLPDSDLWSGRSCCIERQQVSAGTARRVCDFLLFCLL